MLAEKQEAIPIASKDDLMALLDILLDEWDATRGMSQSPVEWCNQDFHTLMMTSMPLSCRGLAMLYISWAGIFSRVLSGVSRSMT